MPRRGVGGFLPAVRILLLVLCVFVSGCQCRPPTTVVMDGELRASPDALAFKQTWVGAPKTLAVEIVNAGRTPRVLEVTTEGEFFEGPATLALGGGEAKSVGLAFAPLRAGAFSGRVVLRDANGQLEVTLSGEGVSPPACTAGPCERTEFSVTEGRCVTTVLADDTACTPGCGASGLCVAGECRLTNAGACEDGNPCTLDACRGDGGCLHVPRECPVSNACKVAACDPQVGCTEAPIEDGTFCGAPTCAQVQVCLSGNCEARARPTPDNERRCTYTNVWMTGTNTCAKTRADTVRCWGDNSRDQLLRGYQASSVPPADFPIGIDVARITPGALCALDPAGRLVCPGFDAGSELYRDVTFAPTLLGVLRDGGLSGGLPLLPAGGEALLTPAARVWASGSPFAACIERESGDIGCWGVGSVFSSSPSVGFEFLPGITEPVRSFGMTTNAFAVLGDGGFVAWGTPNTELRAYPVVQSGPWLGAVGAEVGTIWGRRSDDTVEACGLRVTDGGFERSCLPLPGSHRFTKLAAGVGSACGLEDGGVWCWGTNLSGELGSPVTAQAPFRLSTTDIAFIGDQLWLADGGVSYRFGNARRAGSGLAGVSDVCGNRALKDGALYVFDPGTGAARFVTDGGFVALQPTGEGNCEGVPVSRDIVSRIRPTSGGCSLFFDGGVSCSGQTDGTLGFGPRDAGLQNVGETPITIPPAVVLRGTSRGACTLTAAGRVWCWGDQLGAPVPAQLPLVGVRQLECGFDHCCALAGTNDVRCWGQNTGNELGTPGRAQFTPRSVAIGGGVSRISHEAQCAVLRTGGAVCWGRQQYDAVFSSDVPLLVVD